VFQRPRVGELTRAALQEDVDRTVKSTLMGLAACATLLGAPMMAPPVVRGGKGLRCGVATTLRCNGGEVRARVDSPLLPRRWRRTPRRC